MMNDECRMQDEERRRSLSDFGFSPFLRISGFGFRISFRRPAIGLLFLCSAFCILTSALPAQANPTQEDVFKSISGNMNDKVDGQKVLGVCAAAAGLVILLVLINKRQLREDLPKVTNHQGKLIRELMKTAGLKASQIRQLKAINANLAAKGEPVKNLATLLLCPSLIKKARETEARR
jgi:hypothetical protein